MGEFKIFDGEMPQKNGKDATSEAEIKAMFFSLKGDIAKSVDAIVEKIKSRLEAGKSIGDYDRELKLLKTDFLPQVFAGELEKWKNRIETATKVDPEKYVEALKDHFNGELIERMRKLIREVETDEARHMLLAIIEETQNFWIFGKK